MLNCRSRSLSTSLQRARGATVRGADLITIGSRIATPCLPVTVATLGVCSAPIASLGATISGSAFKRVQPSGNGDLEG